MVPEQIAAVIKSHRFFGYKEADLPITV